MKHVRALVHSPARLHRLLLTFTTAVLLIAGLVSMHTLTGGFLDGHADAARTSAAPAQADARADMRATAATEHGATARTGSDASPGGCADDCRGPEGSPGHSMSTMVCVLALLAAAVGLFAPVRLGRLGVSLASLPSHRGAVLAALPHPRPPSLIVLSISRT
ncbi:DUF6153 family protein [Agrococcus sp. HG114]|uniref:DUF6153 family protein n=1 Tax=Agrococcus sp. HG114 TaxID=2969757 RepID=UPI00215B07DF|nr:DUF6153 family protein [Agrococcus sp. HG114]MCR8670235.1 DUF6153 family protein [Agrococcus sp. HG114]